MDVSDAIVNPKMPRRATRLGTVAILAATPLDLHHIRRLMQLDEPDCERIHLSRLYLNRQWPQPVALVGPVVGAPYAVMVLEALIARGATQVIFVGWCGAIGTEVEIGDVILPQQALIEEGTSAHYRLPPPADDAATCADNESLAIARPSKAMVPLLRSVPVGDPGRRHEGRIWTTDAVYRETHAKVQRHQQAGVLGVEMEFSALCTVARFRGIDVGGLLVVSDALNQGHWQPGFKSERFKHARHAVAKGIVDLCRKLANQKPPPD